ncbi:MAG: chemotaxis protein CheA [Pseudomonadota bacterium]
MSGMEEFHQIFFEEADELIAVMESELLEMVFDPGSPERINDVFRAAHSIKGGAATFGFSEISETTHVMETLMNGVRDGSVEVSRALIDLLLNAVDCVRDLVACAKSGDSADAARAAETRRSLEAFLDGPAGDVGAPAAAEAGDAASAAVAGQTKHRYSIAFKPSHELFKMGNDPLHIFRALDELGDLQVSLDGATVPALEGYEPDRLYLAWSLTLDTTAERESVLEAFEWVEDVCEISIDVVPLGGACGEDGQGEEDGQEPAAGTGAQSPEVAARPRAERRSGADTTSIRVSIDKIDTLINLVGELVITQSMLGELGEHIETCDLEKLREGFAQLERHTRELQENVMKIRMVPVSNVFNRLPRTIHDLGTRLGKKVDLRLRGEQTEMDKTVMERIGDPLVHLVRNAVDHGIETPEERRAAGKPEQGDLELCAYHANGNIVIEIRDDGKGLDTERILAKARANGLVGESETPADQEIHELIFHPGFSTANEVSDVSGRGVGMDVVKQNIQELGGAVEIASLAGRGSTFTIRLPLTLAIVDGQLLRVRDQVYIVPLVSILESIQLEARHLSTIADRGQLYRIRGEYVPVVSLTRLFGLAAADSPAGEPADEAPGEPLLVLVESGQGKVGLLVDDLLAQQQVVVKSLESNFRRVPGISGATILGDGRVALILDIPGLSRLVRQGGEDPRGPSAERIGPRAA